MPIQIKCTKCSKALRAPDSAAGKKVKCPGCGTVLAVPVPATSTGDALMDLLEDQVDYESQAAELPVERRPQKAVSPASSDSPAPPAAPRPTGSGSKKGLIIAGAAVVILVLAALFKILPIVIPLGIMALVLSGTWMVFVKAGYAGWAVLIPFYNIYVFIKIAGKPGWWFFLLFVPVVSLFVGIMIPMAVARNFGKGVGFGLGLIFLPMVFYPILGLGSAQYNP